MPSRTTRQQKNGNIAAANGQQEPHCKEQKIQGSAEFMHKPFVQANHAELEVRRWKMLRRFLGELVDQRLQGGVRNRMGDTRLQSKADIVSFRGILSNLQGEINISVFPCETLGCDSDDRVILADQLEGLTDHGGIGVEMASPELVAEYGNRLRVLTIDGIGGHQSAPERGRNAHERKTVGSHVHAIKIFGQIVAGDRQVPVVRGERVFDHG